MQARIHRALQPLRRKRKSTTNRRVLTLGNANLIGETERAATRPRPRVAQNAQAAGCRQQYNASRA
ncbi:hypothetical protein KCP73_18590 [Salmonella enterica subsp. enterica]|nr:hypothetical protein KCP73_18590 [Salmonella enterica subsp. enterica]